jgi:DNA modification methylase
MHLQLEQADCLTVLAAIDNDSIDALITDPPAGIAFMGKDWDKSQDFITRMEEIYKECLRVLKPGAHGLVWAIPRTSHWTATALEQAGFEIRDVITHVFGSGFPKSLDVSKAIDKMKGAEREVVGIKKDINHVDRGDSNINDQIDFTPDSTFTGCIKKPNYLTAPATPEAKQWDGFGTALKPASEHWILVRKPLGESTVAKNVLKHGTGGLNIDASRISVSANDPNHRDVSAKTTLGTTFGSKEEIKSITSKDSQLPSNGRFPANFVLSHNEDCEDACTEGCAVKMLDEQSGASRFFYVAKASKRDRNEGLEGMPEKEAPLGDERPSGHSGSRLDGRPICKAQNTHPTVKSTKLMEYLIRLICPPQGIVLDPFMGSGSTGVAAKRLGFGFVGIEKEAEYFEIAKKRIGAVCP